MVTQTSITNALDIILIPEIRLDYKLFDKLLKMRKI